MTCTIINKDPEFPIGTKEFYEENKKLLKSMKVELVQELKAKVLTPDFTMKRWVYTFKHKNKEIFALSDTRYFTWEEHPEFSMYANTYLNHYFGLTLSGFILLSRYHFTTPEGKKEYKNYIEKQKTKVKGCNNKQTKFKK